MRTRFTHKQIAAQAGVSVATVDRVLNGRPGAHGQTMLRVRQALRELDERADAGLPIGRSLYADVIMHAPDRFSAAVRSAVLAASGALGSCRVAPRFHLFEDVAPADLARFVRRAADRAPAGIVLKAPDDPAVIAAVADAARAGVPVVTLVTDLPQSVRLAYVGMDNRAAGRTAAFLLGRLLAGRSGAVIATVSLASFRGEEEREAGFRDLLRAEFPNLTVIDVAGGAGLTRETRDRVAAILAQRSDVIGVYSMGGGNAGILDALDAAACRVGAFIGHDLDAENRALLAAGRIDAIVDHDLVQDARTALLHILAARGQAAPGFPTGPSRAVVVTRYNL